MRLTVLTLAAMAAASAAAQPASATLIDFDELAREGTGGRLLDAKILQFGDYQFIAGPLVARPFNVWDRNSTSNPDAGGATLGYQWSSSLLTLSRVDGALFDFISFDIADYFNWGVAAAGDITFHFGDGSSISQYFITDQKKGLEAFLADKRGLTKVTFLTRQSNYWQFDNFDLEKSIVQSAVPETASWTMMICGLFAIGASLRRRTALSVQSSR